MRMSRRGTAIAAAALALAISIGAGAQAAPPTEPAADPRPELAIVEVATPELPAANRDRDRWRRLRSRAAELLGRVAGRNRLAVADTIAETGQLTVELGGDTVASLRRRLAGDPRVRRVQADRPVEPRYLPNDPGFRSLDPNAPGDDYRQWNLRRTGGPAAWDISKGVGAEVAVIDTGADVGHPDLAGRVRARLDCEGGCGGTTVADSNGHGTHVAGLACADSDNGVGIASAGFDCGLFVVRMDFSSCSTAAEAVVRAANRGSDAINMSFGGCSSAMADELAYAWARGSVLVAAAANEPSPAPDYPSRFVQPPGTGPDLTSGNGLVVTAAKHDGTRTSWAENTNRVSVAGFGAATNAIGGQQGILSTWPAATTQIETGGGLFGDPPCNCRTSVGGSNRYAYLVGTSMATPQVAGVVALMRAAAPSLRAPRLIELVKRTASNCGRWGGGLGWGIVSASRAVAAAANRDVDAPRSRVKRIRRGKVVIKRSDKPRRRSCSAAGRSSGVKRVKLFVSVNGGRYRKRGGTDGKVLRFRAKPGRRYRFYSIAIDKAGNREAKPNRADKKLKRKR